MGMSLSHLVLVLVIVLLVFGAGKVPQVMSDLARGLQAFRKGLEEGESSHSTKQQASRSKE